MGCWYSLVAEQHLQKDLVGREGRLDRGEKEKFGFIVALKRIIKVWFLGSKLSKIVVPTLQVSEARGAGSGSGLARASKNGGAGSYTACYTDGVFQRAFGLGV